MIDLALTPAKDKPLALILNVTLNSGAAFLFRESNSVLKSRRAKMTQTKLHVGLKYGFLIFGSAQNIK